MWTPHTQRPREEGAGIGDGPWLLPGDFTISSVPGWIDGLLALFVLSLFVLSAAALLIGLLSWRGSTQIEAYLSLLVIFPFARVSPRSSTINSAAGDLALLFLVSLSLSVDLIGES